MSYCKYKLVSKSGRRISGHRTKRHAEKAQTRSGRTDRYVRKCAK